MRRHTTIRLPTALPSAALLATAVLLSAIPAEANRPFLTDDSDVVGKGAVEVTSQTFLAVDDDVEVVSEITAAYGIADPLELALTLGLEAHDGDLELAPPTLEAKWNWLSSEEGAFGLGTLLGVGLPIGDGASTVLFGYIPFTTGFGPLDLHVNAGAAIAFGGAEDGEMMPTFAAGLGLPAGERWVFVAEGLSGAPDGAAAFEWTVRGAAGFVVIPDVLQVSVGGAGVRAGDTWVPVVDFGLVWAFAPGG